MMNGSLFSVLLLPMLALGHICITYPHQRGDLNVSIPGHPSCYRRQYYCGGQPAGAPTATFIAGQPATIRIQQNLNHFNPHNVGKFAIRLSYSQQPAETDWILLDEWPDYPANDMVFQMNFTRVVRFPNTPCVQCILGVLYQSNNKDEEAHPPTDNSTVFYNCADIEIQQATPDVIASNLLTAPSSISKAAQNVEADTDMDCCAPMQWQGEGTSYSQLGQQIHKVFYDAQNKIVRWDHHGALEPGLGLMQTSTITYYNTPPPYLEYVINHNAKSCAIYGADEFYPWCFGTQRHMTYRKSYDIGGVDYRLWSLNGLGMEFTATDMGCLPNTLHYEDFHLEFQTVMPYIKNSSVFDLPSFCKKSEAVRLH